MAIQDLLADVAVHAQSAGVAVTVNCPVPPAFVKKSGERALRARAQGFPSWITVKVFPPMVTVPFRRIELPYSGTVSFTVPLVVANVLDNG